MEPQNLSARYSVRSLNEADLDAMLALCAGNPLFYQYHPPLATRESILADMYALPPGKTPEDKLFLGFFAPGTVNAVPGKASALPAPHAFQQPASGCAADGPAPAAGPAPDAGCAAEGTAPALPGPPCRTPGQLAALMDLILDHPRPGTAHIGLFMVDGALQGRGVGSAIIADCVAALAAHGFDTVRLGVDEGNPQSLAFWTKNGFALTGERTLWEHGAYLPMQRRLMG